MVRNAKLAYNPRRECATMNKKCMKCNKPATHKFVKVESGQIFDMYFCQEHAAERSPYQKPKVPISEILASLLSQEQAAAPTEAEGQLKCRTCGMPYAMYKKTLILGCAECYDSFQELLQPELRKFHGNVHHLGRKPGGGKAELGGGEMVPVDDAEESAIWHPSEEESAVAVSEPKSAAPKLEPGAAPQPALLTDPVKEIERHTTLMNKAIAEEDFERAAKHRDKIKELRASLGK